MRKDKQTKNRAVGRLVYLTVGILLTLTLLSTWFLSGLYAKYVVSGNRGDSAHVASTGIMKLELWEHKAVLRDGVYALDQTAEVDENTYGTVIPGVDIAKDPFIRLELDNSRVDYALYLNVTESNFPATVTYDLLEQWELMSEKNGTSVYRYKGEIASGTIKILQGDKLYVSEKYVGNGQTFSLTFSAYLQQAGAN